MNSLTKLELKKIISNKAIKMALCLGFLYLIIALTGSIKTAYFYRFNETVNTVDNLKGLEAIKVKKQQVQKNVGYLDQKKLEEVITYYHELKSNQDNITEEGEWLDEAWAKYWLPYLDIQRLIGAAYSELYTFNSQIIDELTLDSAKEFYSNRIKKINEYLELDYDTVQFDANNTKAIVKSAQKLPTPLYYEYSDGWVKLMDNFYFLNVVIILILCFSVSIVFTGEIQNSMILVILPTVNGKSKLAVAKIKASIYFSSISYFVFNILFAGILLVFYGFDGWNCPIQIENSYWLSIYNVKFYQAFILGTIIGFSACIFMTTLTLLLANIVKKAFLTISAITVLLLVPIFINTASLSKGVTNLIEILPIKALNFTYTLRQQSMYSIFGLQVHRGYITPFILIIGTAFLIPFIVKLYQNQQV